MKDMQKAFITGIAGQDGSILAEKLLVENYEVVGLLLPGENTSNIDAFAGKLTLIEGNLTDFDAITKIILNEQPDVIFNLGGISSVALSWKEPVLTNEVTGVGAVNLMEAAWKLHEQGKSISFVQASSSEIFGTAKDIPQTEATALAPVSPYGVAKSFAHQMSSIYRARGLNISTVILFPHESTKRPVSFVTRKITNAVARIKCHLQDTLELGSLDVKRDWGYAPDFVDAMIEASKLSADTADDFILATGKTHTIEEFAQAAFEAVGIVNFSDYIRINPEFVRPADPSIAVGDASKAREKLRLKQSKSFSELVKSMVEYDLELLN